MRRVLWSLVALATFAACGVPDRDGGRDEDPPVASDGGVADAGADTAPDAGSASCKADSDCGGGHCDRNRGVCVTCLSASDCGATQACSLGRCVARTSCTSSRTCPGQVCDTQQGYCVDCVGDNDCASGESCQRNLCQAPPRTCRSSRECSASGQVCDTQQGLCVDCVADTDCESGQYCGSTRVCRAQACAPLATECLDPSRMRTCDTHGSRWYEQSCLTNETCAEGHCQARICQPNSATCQSTTTRLVCDATGLHQTVQTCGANERCVNGTCTARVCEPGTVECVGSNQLRTCNADGLGWTQSACTSPAHATGICANNRCGFTCASGWADCNGQPPDGCEASLDLPETCGSCNTRCAAGSNATATCTNRQCGLTCAQGTRSCNGSCVGDLVNEACDGSDNDCDGQIDEGCNSGTCSSPFLVAPAGGVISGTMLGYSTVNNSCGYGAGVDRIFRWVPSKSGTATINLSGDYYPVSLYVRSGSCSGAEIACKSSQQWSSPTLNPTVSAGSAYYIVVDAQWASASPPPPPYTTPHYTLTVTPPP